MTGSSVSAPHVVVVDDEPDARAMVGDYLRLHGFDVALCDGGRSLRAHLEGRAPDLIVLDLNMPEEDGLSIVRDLKSRSRIPIIMLTATASPIDRVVGLELGADDYLPKPCELRELVARVRSVLRRAITTPAPAPAKAAEAEAPARRVRFGTKWLELDAVRLRDDQGVEQALTRSEFDLLKAFADHPKRALSRERLLDLADARDPDAFDRAIDVRINRIRKKVEPDPANPRFIRTVRGLGYVFRPEGD
ncbi:response regulator [Methylorubrum sp. SB2]|uniref:response regulator n=1 Tax=Methylorubrum subtropicum TaxID=3138812 RepID=UPI00313BB72B